VSEEVSRLSVDLQTLRDEKSALEQKLEKAVSMVKLSAEKLSSTEKVIGYRHYYHRRLFLTECTY
jgi:hypothetical protein